MIPESVFYRYDNRLTVVKIQKTQHFRGRFKKEDGFLATVLWIGKDGEVKILRIHRRCGFITGCVRNTVGRGLELSAVRSNSFKRRDLDVQDFLARFFVVNLGDIEIASGDPIVIFDFIVAVIGERNDNGEEKGAKGERKRNRP